MIGTFLICTGWAAQTVIYAPLPHLISALINLYIFRRHFSESAGDPRHKKLSIQQFPHRRNRIKTRNLRYSEYATQKSYKCGVNCPAFLSSPLSNQCSSRHGGTCGSSVLNHTACLWFKTGCQFQLKTIA